MGEKPINISVTVSIYLLIYSILLHIDTERHINIHTETDVHYMPMYNGCINFSQPQNK